jgi:hypothetical protein
LHFSTSSCLVSWPILYSPCITAGFHQPITKELVLFPQSSATPEWNHYLINNS